MEFSLEELQTTLEEMGFKDIPADHLELFAKDLERLMKHERHVQKKKITLDTDTPASTQQSSLSASNINDSSNNDCQKKPPHSRATEEDRKLVNCKEQNSISPASKTGSSAHLPTRAVKDDTAWKKLKTDPVKLYGWYKTFWDVHGLK